MATIEKTKDGNYVLPDFVLDIDRWEKFSTNEIYPRIRKNISSEWEKIREASLFGSDIFKLKESGIINIIQARQYLDEHIGKLHG